MLVCQSESQMHQHFLSLTSRRFFFGTLTMSTRQTPWRNTVLLRPLLACCFSGEERDDLLTDHELIWEYSTWFLPISSSCRSFWTILLCSLACSAKLSCDKTASFSQDCHNLEQASHLAVKRAACGGCHMSVTWVSHECHMSVTWRHHMVHVVNIRYRHGSFTYVFPCTR